VRLDASYVQLARGEIGVRVLNRDRTLPLTVDPVLSYSTLLSGSSSTNPMAIALDPEGNAYVTGWTASADLPGTSGTGWLFAAKSNPAGSGLLYATYFGSNKDRADGIAVDGSGNAYVTGWAGDASFPVTPGTVEPSKQAGGSQGFLLKFGPSGRVVWGTYIDGLGYGVAVDGAGNSYVTGIASNFPTTSGECGSDDAFVATLNPSGSAFLDATCIGGSAQDIATAIALGPQSSVYITGITYSTDLPTTQGSFQGSRKSDTTTSTGFVAKLTSGSVSYLTYLWGSSRDQPASIAVDRGGDAYIAGFTSSLDFPVTPAAFQTTRSTSSDGESFVTKLNSTGTGLVFSTYLGACCGEGVAAVNISDQGDSYVTGWTESPDFPTTPGAIFSSQQDYWEDDVFVAQLSQDGSALLYSGRIGTAGRDMATGMARSADGALYITGWTLNYLAVDNFPTTPGALQTTFPSQLSTSGFITKVDMTSTATCTPTLSPESAQIPGHGGSLSFDLTISSGCPWEAIADQGITLGQITHGTTSATVVYTIGANNDTRASRTLRIVIGPKTYTIAQNAGSCQDPVFDPPSLVLSNSGGAATIGVILPSGCPRVATAGDGWIQVTAGGSTPGSGNVGIVVASNAFGQRSGAVTIAGRKVSVVQDAGPCSATVEGPAAPLPAAGGIGSFQIQTSAPSCQWTVYGAPPWLRINASSPTGQGSATPGFVIAPNITRQSRDATLEIAGQSVSISQEAGPYGTGPDSYTASIFAGGGPCCGGERDDGGPATSAYFGYPAGLAWRNGDLYIADEHTGRVKFVTPDGLIHTFAGGGAGDSGPPIAVDLGQPGIITFAPDGTAYISDMLRGAVWKVAGGSATVIEYTPSPNGLATDGKGNLYFTNTFNDSILEFNGGTVSTIAGLANFACAFSGDNGPATQAAICPWGLAYNAGLFVADEQNQRVRLIDANGIITTFAGGGTNPAPPTGAYVPATSISFNRADQLAFDSTNNLYVTDDTGVWKITGWRQADASGPQITKLTGGTSGIDLTQPYGVAADDLGDVYVSSSFLVWKLTPDYSVCSIKAQTPGALVLTPADGAANVVTDPILTWTAVSGATSYDVYFGTANPPLRRRDRSHEKGCDLRLQTCGDGRLN